MTRHSTNKPSTIVTSCLTQHNMRSKVSILRHRVTGQIFLEGPLQTKWTPPHSDEFPTPVIVPPDYVNKYGYFDSGMYRCSKNGVTYARNGRRLDEHPQLELVANVDYDTAFRVLSFGHAESIGHLESYIGTVKRSGFSPTI